MTSPLRFLACAAVAACSASAPPTAARDNHYGSMGGVSTRPTADADRPPLGAKSIRIDYTYSSFQANELHYKLEWDKSAYRTDSKATVDGKLVAALYASLVNLNEYSTNLTCVSHTDDYPHITITIEGDAPLVIETESNCHGNIPWNVIRNGKHYAQLTAEISLAASRLLAAVDPKNWTTYPDTPPATMSFGIELVKLGTSSSYAPANACAKDLATNAILKKAFGAISNVALDVSCDLSRPDCKQLVVQAGFEASGVRVDAFELSCIGGRIDVDAATATLLDELKWFIDSKPMRTLARFDPPVLMWPNGEWMASGSTTNGPDLSFTVGAKLIHIRAWSNSGPNPRGVAYLKALGLDGKKLTKRVGIWFETEVDVDANGNVIR